MRLRPKVEEGALQLGVATSNLGVGHSFPSGPFDLNQVWLELWVEDAAGNVLHHAGDLDDSGGILGAPLRLGARELDEAGNEIPRHRILEVRSVADKRVVGREGKLEDTVRVPLPESTSFPLEVRARWLFRRANPEFSRWALGRDGPEGLMPTWELARARRAVPSP